MKVLKKIIAKVRYYVVKKPRFMANKNLLTRFSKYRKAVMLGSGPSINKFDLTNFSDDTMVISMGNFYEHPEINEINPSIHIFAASHSPITEVVLINWWSRCHEVLPLSTPIMVEKRDQIIAERIFKDREVFVYSYGGSFPVDFTKQVKSPYSVSQVAMQLGMYLNYKKMYFFGIDLHWRLLEPYLHFYSHESPSLEYYLKEENILIPYEEKKDYSKKTLYYVNKVYESYEELNNEAKQNNITIVNANINSQFDVFPYEEYS